MIERIIRTPQQISDVAAAISANQKIAIEAGRKFLLDATECNMTKCSGGVVAVALAAAVVLCDGGEALAHRWHGSRGFGWGAPRYGYSHSYYPTYAYGPGFVYAPNYAAMVYNYAYFYQRRPW